MSTRKLMKEELFAAGIFTFTQLNKMTTEQIASAHALYFDPIVKDESDTAEVAS